MDKILCVCNQGNCRSVGTRYLLNKHGYKNVIAIGGANTSAETLKMLSDWADIILLAKPVHNRFIPEENRIKINEQFTIGEDLWNNPMNKELHKTAGKALKSIGLISK